LRIAVKAVQVVFSRNLPKPNQLGDVLEVGTQKENLLEPVRLIANATTLLCSRKRNYS
jgi:hypothetical protein